ncbi:MAG: UDP-2,4-diacetamido-2,4,6-trideoxy-beta-L-altropyranose hydrolase [Acidobacteriota bacterium]|jgi:UDP-2,4-diacetamido-2,4,6-trideoxy-beta-L-altropyranose hydrolase|nr:UDP-2,4-diacetamido-2,4,6-trideoxy-beta-L-altropyranose hydrolase [Acidobacteriota bacterium]
MPTAERLLIRTDASPTIGAGHVMRCLALAQQWRIEGRRVTFACSELPAVFVDRLRSEGCKVVIFDAEAGSPDDAATTLKLAHDLDAVVVADGYRFSVDYQRAVYGKARALLVFDDFGQIGAYQADLILDQNLGTSEDIYVDRPPNCMLLLGPEYVMLRREFLDTAQNRSEVSPAVCNVLVTTGGADVGGFAIRILDVLEEIPEPLNITVVVGGASSGTGPIEVRARNSHHRVRSIENAANMAQLMAEADLAVSTAGSTVWELAYLGVPAVIGVVAENQRLGAAALERSGAAVAFDGMTTSAAEELRQVIRLVCGDQPRRSAMIKASQGMIDGMGAARVVSTVIGNLV